ncbi:MAG TPA: patatin-like phospholipase family protein [Ktedonobacteraceae bacterium]|nr:patatin-like phospholipase family protein [Ktedonobacteraceae bacterium]
MQNLEPLKLIEASSLFRDLQPDETTAIIARLRSISFACGSRIIERGVWHGLFYIIASGRVSVLLQEELDDSSLRLNGPDARALARLGPGECFGEMSLITGELPSATIRAEEDVQLWALPQADFLMLVGSCPTLLRNINSILSLRLARTNQQVLQQYAAERIWISLLDEGPSPIQRSLVLHIAAALAERSRKRVLLLECCDQKEAVGLRFVAHAGQLRPALASCARDQLNFQPHRASTRIGDGLKRFPALAALTDFESLAGVNSGSGRNLDLALDALPALSDLARLYEYILLVTTPATPPEIVQAVAQASTHSLCLLPASLASSKRLEALSTAPSAVFVTDVLERPTIGRQDHYAALLGVEVARLLPADESLLERCWERRSTLMDLEPEAALTQTVDFVARSIAHQTVGIAFGGGGARGFAHLGVLERLLAHKVPVDYIAACSSGIITPGMYLIGKSFPESEEIFLQIQKHIVQWRIPRTSLFSNRGLKRMLQDLCGDLRFEDLTTPFSIVAVDLATRSGVVLDRGPIWQAGLASVSLPGIFPPVLVGEHILMDAGMHDPVPVRLVRKMGADILLASELGGQEPPSLTSATPWLADLNLAGKQARSPHIVDLLLKTYDLAMATIGMHSIREADVVIRPRLHQVSLRQFSQGRKFVAAGRDAVEHSLPSLQKHLPWLE